MNKIKSLIKQMEDIFNCVKYFGVYAWKNKPVYYFYIFLQIIVDSIGPFFSIIGSKYLIDEIVYNGNKNLQIIIFWITFICVGTYLYKVLSKYANEKQNYCNDYFERMLDVKLSRYTMKMIFEHTENSQILEKMNKANKAFKETRQIQGLTEGIVSLVSNIFILMGVIYIVLNCSVLLIVPLVVSFIVNTLVNLKVTELNEEYFEIYNEQSRVSDYYAQDLAKSDYAKDIRVYSAVEMLLDNQAKQGKKIYQTAVKYMKKQWNSQRSGIVIMEISNIGIYTILIVNILLEKVSVGNFSSVLQSVFKFSNALNGISEGFFGLRYTTNIMKYYFEFMEMVEKEQVDEETKIIKIPNIEEGVTVEFKNVSFKYPNTEVYILRNINLNIELGEHISIVGKNGAGKTTFIKLLCRLYNVTEGEILINGVNINDIDYNEYVKILSVVFQDYKLFAFSIKENVCCGLSVGGEKLNYNFDDDKEQINKKVEEIGKLVGVNEWIDSLEKKYDTNLYKIFDEAGIEPSGGQGQKLAIARTLYKNSPLVILDEPTAALDPIAEYDIYKNFNSLVGGKTTIYISHRLSSCRFSDRIIVFDNGTIVENGSHDELMNIKDGAYRNMYETQAKHYQ